MQEPEAELWRNYLHTSIKEFKRYKSLAERAMEQLEFRDIVKIPNEGDNSIGILVKHMAGNLRSRFTNFLEEDGEKPWRDRDSEFRESATTREELMEDWESAWELLFTTLKELELITWNTKVYIRKEGHTLVEAISRQLAHHAAHAGQIVYIAKQIKGKDFKSLSIPKDGSEEYNKRFFKDQGPQ